MMSVGYFLGFLSISLNNSKQTEKQTLSRRKMKGKDRDGEIHKETVTGDGVTKIFACSLAAGKPSLSFLQFSLLLREE